MKYIVHIDATPYNDVINETRDTFANAIMFLMQTLFEIFERDARDAYKNAFTFNHAIRMMIEHNDDNNECTYTVKLDRKILAFVRVQS
jgi:hypothetical protein